MRVLLRTSLVVTAMSIGVPTSAHADEHSSALAPPPETSIRASFARHLDAASPAMGSQAHRTAATHANQAPVPRSFIQRHPVVSGLLIGMAAGTAVAAAAWGNEGAFVGFYSGAAAGATLGWVLSR